MRNKVLSFVKVRASKIYHPPGRIKVVHSKINGYDILALANEDVGRRVLAGSFEFSDTLFLSKQIRDTDVCFDIGANIGYYSFLMAKIAHNGLVHAFEPVPINYYLLNASAEINGFSNVKITLAAVADKEGQTSFSKSFDGAFSSIKAVGRKPEAGVIQANLISIDKYIEENSINRVDVMKIDVEGAEELVIRGGAKLLRDKTRRPRLILMELYDENFRPYGTSVKEVDEMVSGFGYKPFVIDAGGNRRNFLPELYNRFPNVFFEAI